MEQSLVSRQRRAVLLSPSPSTPPLHSSSVLARQEALGDGHHWSESEEDVYLLAFPRLLALYGHCVSHIPAEKMLEVAALGVPKDVRCVGPVYEVEAVPSNLNLEVVGVAILTRLVVAHLCQAFAGNADRSVYPGHHSRFEEHLRSRHLVAVSQMVVDVHWPGMRVLFAWDHGARHLVVDNLDHTALDRSRFQQLVVHSTGHAADSCRDRNHRSLRIAAAESIRMLDHEAERTRHIVSAARHMRRSFAVRELAVVEHSKAAGALRSWRTDRRPCRVN